MLRRDMKQELMPFASISAILQYLHGEQNSHERDDLLQGLTAAVTLSRGSQMLLGLY